MMYKLIVVDDEEVVLEGLRQFIDWNSMGYQLIGCFEDGKDAIDYIQNHEVDVVLTDIDMIHVSGLELAQFIHHHFPQIKTVIVSGHKDFQYAKKAIEYNVEHYLTKPTDINEIISVFQKIKEELDLQIKKEEEEMEYRQRYDEVIPLLKEQFLIHLLSGSISNERELKTRLEAIKFPSMLVHGECCLIHVYLNPEQGQEGFSNHYLKSTLQRFFNSEREDNYYISSYFDQKTLKVLALSMKKEREKELIHSVEQDITKIKRSVQKNFGVFLTFEKSPMYENVMELSQNIHLKMKGYDRNLKTYAKSDLEIKEYRTIIQQYRQFISLIMDGNGKEVEASLNRIFTQLETFSIETSQRLIIDLFSMISHTFVEMGINVFEISKGKVAYQGVLSMNNIEEIKEWCSDYLQQIIAYYEKRNQKSSSYQIINQAKKYIHLMYHKDISLEDVANYVYLNHVYFSRLFKQQTGTKFSDYLTNLRIDKAIELLKENKYKTYEISEKVGYKSSKYFSRVFKQATGCSPKEYCRKFTNERSLLNE
ncbi:response regulator [Halalkalibacterium halodurans]|uniref:response regulator n=1 Tax=Halalkalibacterium halodurans TaxID=86665 RepID=UPI002AA9FB41|nr:response regulator [Halalkalibacterium halodurans]MDY7223291.1 response regulator [Halalkalibacterium halodurans]MDY7242512.1 response regulator [Halalkalibacterium halodurans]